MTLRRLVALTGAATLAGLLPALPAAAHGAPTTPISRTAACASGGSDTSVAACKAAKKATGGTIGAFDNLRIPNVNGNDRKAVPDGQLCSGGLESYRGLDLARDDFPATKVTSGQTLKIRYRTTIPHAGSFRVYLTGSGYDPATKLTWDDLGRKPLVDVKDPPVKSGAYTFSAKLPARTGRQILYIVWQTSSTPDTYYSCSDLAFEAAPAATPSAVAPVTKATSKPAVAAAGTAPAVRKKTQPPSAAAAPAAAPVETTQAPLAQDLTPVGDESSVTLGHEIVAGAVILGIGALLWALVSTQIRRRRENR